MRRQDVPLTTTLLTVVSDAAMVGGGCLLAWWIRFLSGCFPPVPLPPYAPYRVLGLLWLGLSLVLLQARGAYRIRVPLPLGPEARLVLSSQASVAALLFGLSFFLRRHLDYSRWMMAMLPVCTSLLILSGRALVRDTWGRYLEQNQLGVQTLLWGEPSSDLVEQLENEPGAGRHLLGWVSLPAGLEPALTHDISLPDSAIPPISRSSPGAEAPSAQATLPYLGAFPKLAELLDELAVHEVLAVSSSLPSARLLEVQLLCERHLVQFRVVVDLFAARSRHARLEHREGLALIGVEEPAVGHPFARLGKRLLDVVGSLLGLVGGLPIMWLAARRIRREAPGPAFYMQERCGLDGKVFRLYKLRTMPVQAEAFTGPVMAEAHDPRATPTGAWLRRYHLDEIPQFYNVLRGEMSLVGPRPERPFFVEQFKHELPHYMTRHHFKPGMTGWAQIHGLRGPSHFAERLAHDLDYAHRWSLGLDLHILAATVLGIRYSPRNFPASYSALASALRPAQGPQPAPTQLPLSPPSLPSPPSPKAGENGESVPAPSAQLPADQPTTEHAPIENAPIEQAGQSGNLAPQETLVAASAQGLAHEGAELVLTGVPPEETLVPTPLKREKSLPLYPRSTPLSYDSQWPSRGSGAIFSELLKRRALIALLVRRDLVLRYRGSLLGLTWNLLNPCLNVLVIWLVFSHILRPASTTVPFVLYLLSGVMVSGYVTTGVQIVGASLQSSVHLLKKVYLPAEVLASATALSLFISLVLLLLPPLLLLQVFLGLGLPASLVLAPLPLILLLGATLGLGLLVAAAAVHFADILDVVRVALQLLGYLTPTFYSLTLLPPGIRRIVLLNPVTHYLELFRALCFGTGWGEATSWGVAFLTTWILLAWGSRAYTKAAQLAVAR